MISLAQDKRDHRYMHRALELARKGRFTTGPNPAVGCVVVKDEHIVGEGWHQKAGEPHAEVFALQQAGALAEQATAYVTLEPCSHHGRTPPCVDALIEAKVARVVIAMQDPNPVVSGRGIHKLHDADIEVRVGLFEAAARALNPGFIHRMQTQMPFVRVKLASSLDGRTALNNGVSQWITGESARADVQVWRAQADAILTGADTVLTDNPRLNVRPEQWPEGVELPLFFKQPVRVIIDGKNRVHDDLRLFEVDAPVFVIRTHEGTPSRHNHFHEIIAKADNHGRVDLRDALKKLALREINSVWTECGGQLAGALFDAQLVNELVYYQANKVLGSDARSMIALRELTQLEDALSFNVLERRMVGEDIRVIAQPMK